MIGAPPGYVGYSEGGQLTEAVKRRPFNVILFDEAEKAHSKVLNVFLQLLDEGRLTDGQGNLINFKNTVIILTSNLGSEILAQYEGKLEAKDNAIRDMVMEKVKKFFKPEFLNRLDEICIFTSLGKEHLKSILDMKVKLVNDRLKEQSIEITLTDDAKKFIVESTYSVEYGARNLNRYVERVIVTEISKLIIKGDLKERANVQISLRPNKEELVFQVFESAPSAKKRKTEKPEPTKITTTSTTPSDPMTILKTEEEEEEDEE